MNVYRENNNHIVYDVLTPDLMKAHIELEGTEYFLDEGDVVRTLPNMKHRFLNKSDNSSLFYSYLRHRCFKPLLIM
ncbi:hypothetical protein GCM10008934_09820 [Virgibacillus salarius]